MNDSQQNKPISTFDEICHLTIETMRNMDMETLLQLKKQATREFDRAKLTKGCIELALSLKAQDQDRAQKEADENQQSLLD
ncbi:MAG: hypothetical protein CMM93_05160 [Rickettsiales bacterium]|nr:hypothetical protein [Rickettsiales bacterium]|tara:strand:+ start:1513 stop:1755 length:243 start_codon:yes stop_codon:yes gene_type:complete